MLPSGVGGVREGNRQNRAFKWLLPSEVGGVREGNRQSRAFKLLLLSDGEEVWREGMNSKAAGRACR